MTEGERKMLVVLLGRLEPVRAKAANAEAGMVMLKRKVAELEAQLAQQQRRIVGLEQAMTGRSK